MVAFTERQRLRRLLSEAVTMLCKSSLNYNFGFSIEGLIGVTVDNNQVILVNINEEITNRQWSDCNRDSLSCPKDGPIDLRIGFGCENKNVCNTINENLTVEQQDCHLSHKQETYDETEKKNTSTSEEYALSGTVQKVRRLSYSPINTCLKNEGFNQDSQNILQRREERFSSEPSKESDIILVKEEDVEPPNRMSLEAMESMPPQECNRNGLDIPFLKVKRNSPEINEMKAPDPTSNSIINDTSVGGNKEDVSISKEMTYDAGTWAAGKHNRQLHRFRKKIKSKSQEKEGLENSPSNSPDLRQSADQESIEQNQLGEVDQTEWPLDPGRRPRASYSTAYKLMVVRKAMESGNMRATARKFGIHFKQVWQWTRNKDKLLAMSLSALRSPRFWPQNPSVSMDQVSSKSIGAKTSTASSASPPND